MRVAVIGAGAVGGAIAAALARGGHQVEVTSRGEHLVAIQRSGLTLRGAWGDATVRVDANEFLEHGAELAIVTTKAQDAATAIRENIGYLRNIPVLVVQNGLDGVATAAKTSPRSHVVGALAMFAASFLTPGEVTVTTAGPIYISGGEKHDLAARYIASVLNPHIPTQVINNFSGAQWTKLIVNQINALPAITGLSAQEVISDSRLRRILTASLRENARIGFASKVVFGNIQSLTNRRLRLFSILPLFIGQILPLAMKRKMGPTPNPGSTLQSIRRGQPTEIDYLNGAVVTAAEAIGKKAPINAALVALVHEVETSGKFLTVEDVATRVPLR
jgi:2-dehydropantoate 2-reductase